MNIKLHLSTRILYISATEHNSSTIIDDLILVTHELFNIK